jgi:hypothetical protein
MNNLTQEIEAATNCKARHGYTTPAIVLENKLSAKSRKTFFSFRFEMCRNVGEVIRNEDGSIGIIRAIV